MEYWPITGDWEHDVTGWDGDALAHALEVARGANTTDVAIVRGGRLVVDAVWTPTELASRQVLEQLPGGRVRQDVASAQKSVTSVLAGIAVGKGLLELEQPVSAYLGAGWSGPAAPKSEPRVTVRHLLTMTSGLADDLSFVAEPGTRWDYNLGPAYHTVKRVVASAAGLGLDELTRDWLTEPLHMTRTTWVQRKWTEGMPEALRSLSQYPNGEPIEGLVTTALDLARFGLSVLRDCRSPLGPPGVGAAYLSAMRRPSQDLNPAYGYLWWLNGQNRFLRAKIETVFEGPLMPGVPGDAFAAVGAMDRFCVVIPSLDLVVARSGATAQEQSMAASRFLTSFTADVCNALK